MLVLASNQKRCEWCRECQCSICYNILIFVAWKKGPVLAKQNLYLSSAKALQPRCLSPSAAESSQISSACDTRCLGGKFNYFSLIRCTIPFCGIFCKEEPRRDGSFSHSLVTRVARAESSEICTVFLFVFSSFCPHPPGAISARDWTPHPPPCHLSTSTCGAADRFSRSPRKSKCSTCGQNFYQVQSQGNTGGEVIGPVRLPATSALLPSRIRGTSLPSHRWSKRAMANGLRSAPPPATLVHDADLQDDRKDDRMGLFSGLTPDQQSGSAAAGHSLPPEPIKVRAMWLHAADQNLPQVRYGP